MTKRVLVLFVFSLAICLNNCFASGEQPEHKPCEQTCNPDRTSASQTSDSSVDRGANANVGIDERPGRTQSNSPDSGGDGGGSGNSDLF